MIVTMDGPAGAGKSSVAKQLAHQLGFAFLDTGAMYRCATYACLANNVVLSDPIAVEKCSNAIRIAFEGERICLNGEDVTDQIRTPEVTCSIKCIADNLKVRERMVHLQREYAKDRNIVTEGRDQGTVAFPNAECKIFLTASPEERARRRVAQLLSQGIQTTFEEVFALQQTRDEEDSKREMGALRIAADSIYFLTDNMSEEQVIENLIDIVLKKRNEIFLQPSPSKEPQRSTKSHDEESLDFPVKSKSTVSLR